MSASLRIAQLAALVATAAAVGYCNDQNPSCHLWAKDGECSGKNAESLATMCAHSCGTCDLICKDTETACGDWAKKGECEKSAPRNSAQPPRAISL